jgi:hypothetical protein
MHSMKIYRQTRIQTIDLRAVIICVIETIDRTLVVALNVATSCVFVIDVSDVYEVLI